MCSPWTPAATARAPWAPDGDYSIARSSPITCCSPRSSTKPYRDHRSLSGRLGGLSALLGEGEHGGTARALALVDIVPRIELSGAERIGEFMRAAPSGSA